MERFEVYCTVPALVPTFLRITLYTREVASRTVRLQTITQIPAVHDQSSGIVIHLVLFNAETSITKNIGFSF